MKSCRAPVSPDDLVAATGLTRDEVLDALVAMPFIHVRSLEQIESESGEQAGEVSESPLEFEEQKQLLADAIAAACPSGNGSSSRCTTRKICV